MKPPPINDLDGLRSLGSVLLTRYHNFGSNTGDAKKTAVAPTAAVAPAATDSLPNGARQATPAEDGEARQRPSDDASFNLWRAFDSRVNACLDGQAAKAGQRRPLLELATAVVPVAGGVGATTITATLACLLAEQGQRVLVVDTDSDPLLSVYLGDTPAYGTSAVSADGLGRGSSIHVLTREDADAADSEWLQRGWQRLEGRFDRALIDVWPGASPETFAHAVRANKVLLVMTPDLSSVLRLPRVLARIQKSAPEGEQRTPKLLLNKFDASLELHREVRLRLSDRFGEQLLPFEIRRSDEPAEALAAGATVLEFAGQSGVTQDLLSLLNWMIAPPEGSQVDAETGLVR
jgi:chromosome partitioning protein